MNVQERRVKIKITRQSLYKITYLKNSLYEKKYEDCAIKFDQKKLT